MDAYIEEQPLGQNARTAVSDQQMRPMPPRYPVDRYLVESGKQIEMVNIVDNDIWDTEPTLKPEDEIILRRLHEMLQSTADDLKLLSGELSKFHEPGVQVKTAPTPLDEEFNEKVHIEEVVNAKFHGYKLVEKAPQVPAFKQRNDEVNKNNNLPKVQNINTIPTVNTEPVHKQPTISRKLGITRTRIVQINGKDQDLSKQQVLNNGKIVNKPPTVAYNEFTFKYAEPELKPLPNMTLKVQEMPSINIRSELREQKVLQLDIIPDTPDNKEIISKKSNVTVVSFKHNSISNQESVKNVGPVENPSNKNPVRKVSKMSTYESSESAHNVSSDAQMAVKTQRWAAAVIRSSPRTSLRNERNKKVIPQKKEPRAHLNLDEWKKKLNTVYGASSPKKKTAQKTKSNLKKQLPTKSNLPPSTHEKQPKLLNNRDYIPYSQLTLGGVRVSDIEKEISDTPINNDMPLRPILDKILSSRENSFSHDSPKKQKHKVGTNVLTTSDENLLQEVIDIEKNVSETLSKNVKPNDTVSLSEKESNESYADDFEEDKSDHSIKTDNKESELQSDNAKSDTDEDHNSLSRDDLNAGRSKPSTSKKMHNTTYTKGTSLSFKKSVDIFEFVHSIDTQETATQSNTSLKLPNETQTSPRHNKPSLQPIHNDLWPTIDPKGEVEKLFKLEKDFIKQLILNEYGDLIENKFSKQSTSKDNAEDRVRNAVASQKNTQTSPAHVKSVMTSPTRTKTRMTSPFPRSLKVDHQTSPLIFVTNEEELKIEIENQPEDCISINLSSPRFSLRLPQNSHEVLCNIEDKSTSKASSKKETTKVVNTRNVISSSSSVDAYSSSDISSLGEVKLRLRRRNKIKRIPTQSESSSTSTVSKYSSELQSVGILPLRSEGEVSLSQRNDILNKTKRSDGELSFERK